MSCVGPTLSIIIPHHNSEALLVELLSIIPERRDIEVVVVDDHSPNPPVICPDDFVFDLHILNNTPDQRYAGTARNLGMDKARGHWTMFMDADDLVDADQLSEVIDQINDEEKQSVSADVYHFYGGSFRENREPGDRHMTTNWLVYNFVRRGNEGPFFHAHPPWGKIIRSDFIRRHKLRFSDSNVANDVMFNIHLCLAEPRRKVIEKVVHHIRQGGSSMTTDVRAEKIQNRIRILREANKAIKLAGKARYQHPLWLQLHYLMKEDRRLAVREIATSLWLREPIFFTRWTLKRKVLSKHDKRRDLFPH